MPALRPASPFALASAILLAAPCARAADPPADDTSLRLPVPEAQRPLTLPRLVLAPTAGFEVDRRPDEGNFGELDVSAAFGITDDLAVHALVAPLELWAPGLRGLGYGETNRNFGPGAGVTFRFVRGRVEIAGELTAHVFTIPDLSGSSVTPSVALRFHANERLRLDVAPAVTLQFATQTAGAPSVDTIGTGAPATSSSANAVRVQVPVTLLGNVTPSLDVGLTTGLTIYDTSDVRDSTGIPAGVLLGFAVPGPHGPVLDVDPFFDFPYLVMPGRAAVTNTGQYQVGVTVTGYLYL